jgi:tyrosine-protein kinase
VTDQPSVVAPDGVSTLHHYLQALWRRKWVLIVPLVLIPLVVFVASKRESAVYEANADVLVNPQQVAETSLIGQTPAVEDSQRAMDTQAQLARVPLVVQRTLRASGVGDRSVNLFLINSVVYPLSDVLRFTVHDGDPELSVRLAGEYARQFVRYRRELDTAGLARAIDKLGKQMARLEAAGKGGSALYVSLADKQQQLEALATLRRSNVTVVQTPEQGDQEQIAPRPLRNTALAFAGAAVLGLILVFLWETLSTKPRSPWEIEAMLGMPFLARLRPAAAGSTALVGDPAGPDEDAFHTLRTNLELANDAVKARTIMVTSLHGGEGKSATVANLAVAAARAGLHVALVDLDLREPLLGRWFGLGDRPGVTSLARGESTLEEALVSVPLAAAEVRGDGQLEVLPAGPHAGHPAEVLASGSVVTALTTLAGRADLVLVDVPPLLDAPDAAAMSPHVDGLVLVVDARKARRPTLVDARRALDSWQVAGLGFALTDTRAGRPGTGALRRAEQPVPSPVVQAERPT